MGLGSSSQETATYFTTVGHFCGRYVMTGRTYQYKSPTCEVWFCIDKLQQDRPLALKFMTCEKAYEREVSAHKQLAQSAGYTQSTIQLHAEESEEATKVARSPKGKATLPKSVTQRLGGVLVMQRAERNLRDALLSEKLASDRVRAIVTAKDIAEALKEFHKAGMAHCDLKPANILRVADGLGERWVLADLDGAAKIGQGCAGAKVSTAYLPPEMLHLTGEEGGEVATPKTFDGQKDGLPELEKADERIDVWAFGIVLYRLCTGSSLLKSDDYDDAEDPEELLTVAHQERWGKWWRDRLARVDKSWTAARDLLKHLLVHEASVRFASMAEVLKHPFFVRPDMPNDLKEKVLILAPIDKPSGCDTLFSVIEEAINIGRQIPNCVVKSLFSLPILEEELNRSPDIVFFCCHRLEDQILLGRNKSKHMSNQAFLSIFQARFQVGLPNPTCIVFSTCGGDEEHEGSVLPKALVQAAIGISFVVFWLGPAPDAVAAQYSRVFVESLAEEPSTLQPLERFSKSHAATLQKLHEAILPELEGSSAEERKYCIDSIGRIKCLSNE